MTSESSADLPKVACQPCQAMEGQGSQSSVKPLSLPRACLSARIAENLGQPVLSRVELLSFVYFYILKDHTVPKTSGPILFTNKLQLTATQLKAAQRFSQARAPRSKTTQCSQLIPNQKR